MPKNYKDQLPYTPQHSGNATTTIETPWINVGYSLTGVSEEHLSVAQIPVNKIDGYVKRTTSFLASANERLSPSAFRQKLSISLTSNMMLSNIIPCPDVPGA